MKIAAYTFEEFIQKVRAFHGNPAPGVVLGGIMVDAARRQLPEGILFNAISETERCLPDSIQMLTPCTFGNGWMKVINTGRFALSLYDKYSGEGARAFVDAEKVKAFPEINNWFFSLKSRKEQNLEDLLAAIKLHGAEILKTQRIKVDIKALAAIDDLKYAICRVCKESYIANDAGICPACQGKAFISEIK
jgi:formylmethanofuran dehydrogenase subunit E